MNSTPNQPTTFNHTNTDTSTTRRDGRGAIPLSSYSLPTPMHPHTMPLPPMSPTNNYQLQPPASPTLAATYPAYTSPSLHSVMSSPPPVSPSFPLPLGVSLTPAALTGTNLCALASISVARLTQAELLFKAKIAMQAERYEEMAYFMKTIVQQQNMPLTTEERGLFAVAYKKLLAQRRMGWRYIYSIEMKEKAAARKLESELSREIEKDNAAKAKEADKSSSSDGDVTPAGAAAGGPPSTNTDETKTKTQTSTTLPQTSTTPANNTNSQPNPSASHIQSLQSRLATLTTNLQHVHSYRYQLFYESSLLISEVSSLLLDHLLPKLLTQHAQSEDVFTRSIPMIIEQVISWERKRSGRSKGAGVGVGSSAAQQPASSKDKSSSLSTNSSSSSSIAPSLESGLTPLLTAMPVPSTTPTPNAALNKLDNSRHWSLEVEFELQLRALDERTRFLSTLRASHAESLVFYLKMLGDHRRLLAEFLAERDYEESERMNQSLQALAWYVLARYVAQPTLTPSNPIRLGLHLNLAVFYYEVLAKPDRACQMASNTYDLALNEWQTRQAQTDGVASSQSSMVGGVTSVGANVSGASSSSGGGGGTNANAAVNANNSTDPNTPAAVAGTYKDSILIMQLLKNNLTMWAQSL